MKWGANFLLDCAVMTSFKSVGDWQSIRELQLTSIAKRVSLSDAEKQPGFEQPLQLLRMWQNFPGALPHASEVRPKLIHNKTLPSMFVLDVIDNGADFRWRLYGTDHSKYFGKDVTGLLMSEAGPLESSTQQHLVFMGECYASRQPILFLTEYSDKLSVRKTTYNIALPLAGDDGEVSRIFGCSVWQTPQL